MIALILICHLGYDNLELLELNLYFYLNHQPIKVSKTK
jgi:hypothetical protein